MSKDVFMEKKNLYTNVVLYVKTRNFWYPEQRLRFS